MASSATFDRSSLVKADGRVRSDPEAVAFVHDQARAEPALRGLADLAVFGAEWGSSGLHFAGTWTASGVEVILKVGVSPAQRWWTEVIAREDPGLAPMLFGSGSQLGDIELGWTLTERLPGGLHPGWGGLEFGMLMAAGARFHQFARRHSAGPHSTTTVADVAAWIRSAIVRGAPGPAAALLENLDHDWTFVVDVCPPEICHGDLHMANVLSRTPAPQLSDVLLIDFEPSFMPWAFEAAYCQVLNSDPDRVGWHGLVRLMAERRAALGLPTITNEANLRRLEAITLAWYALRMWSILGPETDPSWRPPAVWRAATDSYVSQAI
ncbi:aminoglycoside phosphotransferase family protein [Microlunatus speluncae]|uniref:aminoglycoside phosphotransferase family protein n=1 Tax=Microlunatus speluncae TaxID=2594267 RepID=UPI001375D896|nr:aminoglycoside phosphotransferase family protein [Microlunatus speluncae]